MRHSVGISTASLYGGSREGMRHGNQAFQWTMRLLIRVYSMSTVGYLRGDGICGSQRFLASASIQLVRGHVDALDQRAWLTVRQWRDGQLEPALAGRC